MLVAISIILIVFVCVAFFIGGQLGILASFFAKPIIDSTWDMHLAAGLNAPRIVSVVIPVLLVVRLLIDKKQVSRVPLFPLWTVYFIYSVLVLTQTLINASALAYLDLVFRVLNGYLGYIMIQSYFADRDSFRKLLRLILLASLFPLGVFAYQFATGTVWREQTVMIGLERLSGLYHDIGNQRTYILQFLAAMLLYWSYYLQPGRNFFQKSILVMLAGIGMMSLYFSYTKAGVLIFLLWLVIWTVGKRSLVPALIVIPVVLIVNIYSDNKVAEEIELMYSREVTALTSEGSTVHGEDVTKRAFAGRGFLWEKYIGLYMNAPIAQKIFGTGNPRAAHNDFLAILLMTGLVGLILYISLLVSIGIRVVRNYMRERNPLNIMAVMLFAMWLVDSIGLVPSFYPNYQWLVWGMIGLSFKGVQFETTPESAKHLVQPAKKTVPRFIHLPRNKTK